MDSLETEHTFLILLYNIFFDVYSVKFYKLMSSLFSFFFLLVCELVHVFTALTWIAEKLTFDIKFVTCCLRCLTLRATLVLPGQFGRVLTQETELWPDLDL